MNFKDEHLKVLGGFKQNHMGGDFFPETGQGGRASWKL